MVACILERGHSLPMERWSNTTDPTEEYKIAVSEWLLHSNRETFLLPDSDNDSHTPLLIHMRPTWMSSRERRELRNPETLKAAHDSRRERQKAKKLGIAPPVEPPRDPPGKGTARPAEPEAATKGKGKRKRPAEPADPPSGKGKGKRPAEPADPPKGKGKGKKGEQKGEKGKSAKGSTAKGKTKDKHYGKGKGQK